MSYFSKELIDEFINALQISISSEIIDWQETSDHTFEITFKHVPLQQIARDAALKRFVELVGCTWRPEGILVVPNVDTATISLWKDFLILTRLKPENISALSRIDPRFNRLTLNISGEVEGENSFENISQFSEEIFRKMKALSLTIRELGEKTGLSMVAISNFKSGKDIRLSNFLKIAEALGLKLKLE